MKTTYERLTKDGFINEDEQVLLFSLFKSKMLHCSQKLLLIFDYKRFHELMVNVRNLEQNINLYQDTLRGNIYDAEIRRYHEVGREKLEDFLDRYTHRFETFNNDKNQKISQFEFDRQREREDLEKEITSDTHMVKFKPKRELKDYLVNERLVALEERIEEAANFRKELDKMATKESLRLNKNM